MHLKEFEGREKQINSTAQLKPRRIETDTSQVTVMYGYSLSFIPAGFLLPSLSIKCDATSFLSFTLSVNRSSCSVAQLGPLLLQVLAALLSGATAASSSCSVAQLGPLLLQVLASLNRDRTVEHAEGGWSSRTLAVFSVC